MQGTNIAAKQDVTLARNPTMTFFFLEKWKLRKEHRKIHWLKRLRKKKINNNNSNLKLRNFYSIFGFIILQA